MEIEKREQALQERLEKLHAMEQEILEKEKNLKEIARHENICRLS